MSSWLGFQTEPDLGTDVGQRLLWQEMLGRVLWREMLGRVLWREMLRRVLRGEMLRQGCAVQTARGVGQQRVATAMRACPAHTLVFLDLLQDALFQIQVNHPALQEPALVSM